mgnify:CR=1 FL=1
MGCKIRALRLAGWKSLPKRRKAEQEAAEKAKRKKNRQRESNVAHQAKAKAERWAANDGHNYPKRICEQCGKEFYPNSTRQRFCNTDCTKAHQQAEAMFSRLVKQFSEKEGVTEALFFGKSNAVGTENEPHP